MNGGWDSNSELETSDSCFCELHKKLENFVFGFNFIPQIFLDYCRSEKFRTAGVGIVIYKKMYLYVR